MKKETLSRMNEETMSDNPLLVPRKSLLLLSLHSCLTPEAALSARDEEQGCYVLTLETARWRPQAPDLFLPDALSLYLTTFECGGARWYRLRLGFFATRGEAEAFYAGIRPRFPGAWVTRVSKKERCLAGSGCRGASNCEISARSRLTH